MRTLAMLLLVTILSALPAVADVYRWTDDKGVVHYTDKLPAKDAKPAELPALQTYKPSPPASSAASANASAKAPDDEASAPVSDIRIASPQPDETVRDAEGKISIVVSVQLQPGQGVIYYLDGKAQNAEPTASTGFLVTGAERGEHQVAAALVSAEGRELARAQPVTLFMMPSVIRKR